MKYFSMFSGIGGFELGIQRASNKLGDGSSQQTVHNENECIPSDQATPGTASATCIGYSEIDKYAIKVYERNFNGHTNYGNATTINAAELPDFDLLVGGFPCQAFSIAGKRAGFNDTRGTLFFDIARILKEKQPRHLVLENVKGLLSHDGGRTFTTIIGVLADLGYFVEWQVLNSKDFGVPQNRERVIIVGHLGGKPRRKVFPITPAYSQTLRESNFLRINRVDRSTKTYDMSRSRLSSTLTSTMWKGIDASGRTGVIEQINQPRIRRLTPKECERLQGFPDDWTKYGVGDEPISDTQRYKMCGNAVTVNTVEAVMKALL